VREIVHDRTFGGGDVAHVRVQCTVETRGRDHVAALERALRAAGW
jgi:threonine dehydratase